MRPDTPDPCLKSRIHGFDQITAEIRHQIAQVGQTLQVLRLVILRKLDQQQGRRIAAHKFINDRSELRDVAAKRDHVVIDQLDRHRTQFDDVLGCIHRCPEGREVADAQHLAGE